MAKLLNEKDKEYILSIKHADITLDLLKDLFASTKNRPVPKYNTNDKIYLAKGEYYNETGIETTVGRIITNKCLLEPYIIEKLGFWNEVLTDDGIKDLDKKVIDLLISNKISLDDLYYYYDQCNWLGYAPTDFLVVGLNTSIYLIDKDVKKLRDKLVEENKAALEAGDVNVMAKIEKEVLDLAKEKIKDDPSYEIFASGARGSFSNNYKNSVIFRGAVASFTEPNKFNISTHSLVEGIPKEEIDLYANICTSGTYARVIAPLYS